MEYQWFRSLASKVIKDKYLNINPSLFEKLRSILDTPSFEHIFCFCLSEDDDDLGQWRAYADDGYGVCLGFCPASLGFVEKDKRIVCRPSGQCNLELIKVCYDLDEQTKKIEELLDKLNAVKDETKKRFSELSKKLAPVQAAYNTSSHAAQFKNPAFVKENEWRIVLNPPALRDEIPFEDFTPSPIDFRISGKTLVPFYTVSFNTLSPITEVRLGPKTSKETLHTVKLLIESVELGDLVAPTISSATYRTL